MGYEIETTTEFEHWLDEQTALVNASVQARLVKIQNHEHFGYYRLLERGLVELKWKNGIRVYCIRSSKNKIKILLGGTKNGQDRDIKKAYKMF